MSSRLKREECRRTKHDFVFSKWEILIGSSDWEDYSLGKDGIERYRIHNLPKCCSCPGLYELGLAAIPTGEGRKLRKNVSDDIVVVYLGQADNVRTRLQHYGRDGSHLDHGSSIVVSDKSKGPPFQRGPGLFTEIFLKGYSIMFRWVRMTNKKEAEKMEAELLSVFDYAWNTRGNSACRREDILVKLDNALTSPLPRKLQECKLRMFSSTVGININSNVPLDKVAPSKFLQGYLIPQVRKLLKSQPVSLERNSSPCQNHDFCRVVTDDGSICRNKPLFGRKRCAEHKGKRIMTNLTTNAVITSTRGRSSVCGVGLLDGSICMESPVQGRKRCELHKGRRVA